MRRKINKNSVIIIIIVAIFTLSSYSFDQLVIRNEDKIRNLQIKLENTITEIENYHSIENQLISLSDLSLNEYVHLKRSNKYWLKSIIINTDHKKSYLLEKENIKKFSKEFDIDLTYLRFSQHMYDIYLALNTIKNKYADIYWWNSKVFKGEVFEVDPVDILENIMSELTNKELDFYVDIALPDTRDELIKNTSLDDWYDLYKAGHVLINELTKYVTYIEMDLNKIEKYLNKSEEIKVQIIEKISKESTFKNYFILASIASQIFSLLFLLILFRYLIKY
tara:strand:+ start:376 stop:1212 length:837 start_codon:yes stop_codon:yes gene_type:complete